MRGARTEYIHKVDRSGGSRKAKQPRSKLYELRLPKSEHNPRVLFFATSGRRIILLHGFNKSGRPNDKIPESEIAIAERRMQALIEREGERE